MSCNSIILYPHPLYIPTATFEMIITNYTHMFFVFLDYSSLPFFSLPFHPWSSSFFTWQPSLPLKNSLAKNHADPLHHYQVTQLSVVFVFLLVLKVQSTSTARKGRRILEDQAPVTATKMRSVHCTRAGRRRVFALWKRQRFYWITKRTNFSCERENPIRKKEKGCQSRQPKLFGAKPPIDIRSWW